MQICISNNFRDKFFKYLHSNFVYKFVDKSKQDLNKIKIYDTNLYKICLYKFKQDLFPNSIQISVRKFEKDLYTNSFGENSIRNLNMICYKFVKEISRHI